MKDAKGNEITMGAKCMVPCSIVEVMPGNAGNDLVRVRSDHINPTNKQPWESVLNCAQVEQAD